jgi:chaperone modulatory protein CbpM
MNKKELIRVKDFCTLHNIEFSFVNSLGNSGLIKITSVKRTSFIPLNEIPKLEKFVRMHYDLDINLEGIETIHYLLAKMEEMHKELVRLRNRT